MSNTIEESIQEKIEKISNQKFDSFENAVENAIWELSKRLKNIVKSNEFNFATTEPLFEKFKNKEINMVQFTREFSLYIGDLARVSLSVINVQMEITSLVEMKVVYLFKNLEQSIKRIIQIAYSEVSTREFFRWESMNQFFLSKDIILKDVKGFVEFNQLRLVNNNIKHSAVVDQEVLRIDEFNKVEKFTFENLLPFYERINSESYDFLKSIGNLVINDLYHFDQIRIEKIASEFKKRMDVDALSYFSKALKK